MKEKIHQILNSSYFQLLIIYTILILLISLSYISRFTLHFEIFALILGIIGGIIINGKIDNSIKIKKVYLLTLLFLAVMLVFIFRFIPYINNSIPLGYDVGIYKYGIEHGMTNLDNWIVSGGFEPGFLYFISLFKYIFSTDFILIYLLIFFSCILVLSVYLVASVYFNKRAGIIAAFLFAISLIQLKTFTYMYYKNILALSIMLFSIYFFKKSESNKKFLIPFAILSGILGAIHRPTFYIFGLSYFFYVFITPIKNKKFDFKVFKKYFFIGILILIITLSFYIGKFFSAITIMISPVLQGFVSSGMSPGTFITFYEYQFSSLVFLPFAILGFILLLKNKEYNFLFNWFMINSSIVYFQFFFFNRFLIHLDIVLILLSAYAFESLINYKKKFGVIIIMLLLLSGLFLVYSESLKSKPLVTSNELETILMLNNTPKDAYVMVTSAIYSPWVLGYSQRKTIAPGLFDYNLNNKEEWLKFWKSNSSEELKDFLSNYPKPLYIFIGEKQDNNLKNFTSCLKIFYEKQNNFIYEYIC